MQNRRDFLKTATLAALGSGLVVRQTLAGESSLSNVYINKLGLGGKMKMSFFPYELKLKHVQSPNQKIPDRKTKCVIKTHINIKQNVIFGAKLKPV